MKLPLTPRLVSFLVLAGIAAIGTLLILKATPEGLGLSDDSIGYIAGARSILAGQGYRAAYLVSDQPVTHFPPAFPAFLAFIGLFRLDPWRGARLLNALLFGLNGALLGILGWRTTKSLGAGLVLAALFVANGSLLQVHAVAMSEPLFIFFSLLAFWMFDLYFERDQHWLWLVLCGVFVGAAYLTRYAGLALVVTFIAALLILQRDWRSRLLASGIFLGSMLPWAVGWAIRNEIVAGKATNRILDWHPVTASNFDTMLYSISVFLMPVEPWRQVLYQTPLIFEILIVLILGAVLIWTAGKAWRYWTASRSSGARDVLPNAPGKKGAPRTQVIAFTNGLYIFGYILAILASMSLFDASTKFKLRILSPLFVSLLLLLVILGTWLWKKRREVVLVLAILVMGMSVYGQAATVSDWARGGQGFASFDWYRSKAIDFLRTLPPNIPIYTDQTGAVYFYTGRGTYSLPNHFDPVSAEARPGFETGVKQMQAEINAGRAVLAIFNPGAMSPDDVSAMTAGMYPAFRGSGAEIYTAAP